MRKDAQPCIEAGLSMTCLGKLLTRVFDETAPLPGSITADFYAYPLFLCAKRSMQTLMKVRSMDSSAVVFIKEFISLGVMMLNLKFLSLVP